MQAQRLKNSIETSKAELANTAKEYQAKSAIRQLYYQGDAELDELKKEKQLRKMVNTQSEMEAVYNQALAQIEAIKNIPVGGDKQKDDKGSGNNSSNAERIKSKEELVKEEYDLERKAYENQKGLTELSVKEQINALEQLKQKYSEHKDIVTNLDIEMYALRKKANDEWLQAELNDIKELDKGFENTDYTALLDKLTGLKEEALAIYADYPERLKEVEKQVDDVQISAAQNRADKLLSIETKNTDDRIKQLERQIDVKKKQEGIVLSKDSSGNEKLFNYSASDEI